MDESQRELNERIAAEERDALDENTRRYKGGYALGRNDGVREVFDALIAAAEGVNVIVLSDGLLSAMMPLERWIEQQQEAMTDASEAD